MRPLAWLWVMLLLAWGAAPSLAADAPGSDDDAKSKAVTVRLEDMELLDQDGNRVRFRTDVVKDRIVVIDVVYTTCPLVCPILSAIFSDLQDALGSRLGTEVYLLSVSVDPRTDVPARLKEFAARFEAKPGWLFLTGEKGKVDAVLKGLGAYAADFTEHPTMVLVGDGRGAGWTRFFGFPTTAQVLGAIDELASRRKARAAK